MEIFEGINFLKLFFVFFAFIVAVVSHEVAHGYMAYALGDNTAKLEGRLSLNPIKHISLLGSVVIPLLLFLASSPVMFGYAKPVPVDMDTILRKAGLKGAIFVSLAGVGVNFLIAILCSGALLFDFAAQNLYLVLLFGNLVVYNVVLGFFNLLPIPPLDGAKALAYIGMVFKIDIFARYYNAVENYGIIILFLLLLIPYLNSIVLAPISFLISLLLM